MNGSASWKARPSACSFVTPLNAVAIDDDHEADQADLCELERERDHEQHRRHRLDRQTGLLPRTASGRLPALPPLHHLAHRRRELRAIAEPAGLLEQHRGEQPDDQDRKRDRQHSHEELGEPPAREFADEQVLGLAHERRESAERRADRCMHHHVPQECAEAVEVALHGVVHEFVVGMVVLVIHAAVRGEAVIDGVQPSCDGDHHGDDGERIEERREQRRGSDEGEREEELRAHGHQEFREHHQQQVAQEVDAGDHEDQQENDGEVRHGLVVDALGTGQADEDALQCDQPARLERIALQRHREGEDELGHEGPSGDHRAEGDEQERIQYEEPDDRRLVPIGRVAEEVPCQGVPVPAYHRSASRRCHLSVLAGVNARTDRRRRNARRGADTDATSPSRRRLRSRSQHRSRGARRACPRRRRRAARRTRARSSAATP